MKLANASHSFVIEWTEGVLPVLLVEKASEWRRIEKEFCGILPEEESGWVLSDQDKELNWRKKVEPILDPIQLEENQRKIMTSVLNELKQLSVDAVHWEQTQKLVQNIKKYFYQIDSEFLCDLSIDDDFDIANIAKACGLKIVTEYLDDLERLLKYCMLVEDMLHATLIVIWNMHIYFGEEDLQLFYKEVIARHWNILMVESREGRHLTMEKWYIIDRDGCEIY